MLAEGSPGVNKAYLLHPGTFTRVFAKQPRRRMDVRIITGDPSANAGPQDDNSEISGCRKNVLPLE
ncbi:MAG TPA: hypothetical protein VNX88_02335 [Terriglobales bacterium]|nr:hypothetical protein [Terriglobales bacterium]